MARSDDLFAPRLVPLILVTLLSWATTDARVLVRRQAVATSGAPTCTMSSAASSTLPGSPADNLAAPVETGAAVTAAVVEAVGPPLWSRTAAVNEVYTFTDASSYLVPITAPATPTTLIVTVSPAEDPAITDSYALVVTASADDGTGNQALASGTAGPTLITNVVLPTDGTASDAAATCTGSMTTVTEIRYVTVTAGAAGGDGSASASPGTTTLIPQDTDVPSLTVGAGSASASSEATAASTALASLPPLVETTAAVAGSATTDLPTLTVIQPVTAVATTALSITTTFLSTWSSPIVSTQVATLTTYGQTVIVSQPTTVWETTTAIIATTMVTTPPVITGAQTGTSGNLSSSATSEGVSALSGTDQTTTAVVPPLISTGATESTPLVVTIPLSSGVPVTSGPAPTGLSASNGIWTSVTGAPEAIGSASQTDILPTTAAVPFSGVESSTITVGQSTALPTATGVPVATSGTIKTGLGWNAASGSDINAFLRDGSKIGWGWNWGSARDGLPDGLDFMPELIDLSNRSTTKWMTDSQTWSSGTTAVLGYYLPADGSNKTNIPAVDAATGWVKYMDPLGEAYRVGGPIMGQDAVLGKLDNSIAWMKDFINACQNCTVDFLPLTLYYTNATEAIGWASIYYNTFGAPNGVPIAIMETECFDVPTQTPCGADDARDYMTALATWVEATEWVERWAWFDTFPTDDDGTNGNTLVSQNGTIADLGIQYAYGGSAPPSVATGYDPSATATPVTIYTPSTTEPLVDSIANGTSGAETGGAETTAVIVISTTAVATDTAPSTGEPPSSTVPASAGAADINASPSGVTVTAAVPEATTGGSTGAAPLGDQLSSGSSTITVPQTDGALATDVVMLPAASTGLALRRR